MISEAQRTRDMLQTEPKFLADTTIKLIAENRRLLRESRNRRYKMRSLQYPQHHTRRTSGEIDDELKIKLPEEIKYHQEEIHVPSQCQLYRLHKLGQNNLIGQRMPFRNGPTSSDSVCYHVNIDVSGPFSAHESGEALDTKQSEPQKNLRRKINGLEEERGTLKLRGALQTKEGHYESRMYEADMYHLGSQVNRGEKKSYVHIWQQCGHVRPQRTHASQVSTPKVQEGLPKEPEETKREVPELSKGHLKKSWVEASTKMQDDDLKKSWVEASLQNLITSCSEASRQNVQKGLQALMGRLGQKGSAAPKQNLKEWLEASTRDLQEVCPAESRKDVKEWLEISKNYLKQGEPEISRLSVQGWLKSSMKSIQDFQEKVFERSTQNMQEDLPKEPEEISLQVPELSKKSWVEASLQNLIRSRSEASRQNVQKGLQALMSRLSQKGSAASKQNLKEWLEASARDLQEVCPVESRKDMKEWLEIAKSYLQNKGPETSRLSVQDWLKASMKSIQDLQERNLERSAQNVQEDLPEEPEEISLEVPELFKKSWVEASLQNLIRSRSEASRQNVQEGLQALISRLSQKGSAASKQNLKEWLEGSARDLQEVCPAESRKDMKEWLEIAKSYLKEGEPEISRLSVQDWLKASMKSIQDLQERGFERSTQNVQEDLPEEPEEIILEVPGLSKGHLKKSWVEASTKSIRDVQERSFERSTQNVQDDLPEEPEERSLDAPVLSKAHLSKDWLEASRENLRRSRSEASRQNVQKWLQASMSRLRGAPEAVKENLMGWLEASIKHLPEEYPESSRKDVKEWLELSKSYLQKGNPEISKLNVEDWLQKSLSGIQELQHPQESRSTLQVLEREPSIIEVRSSLEKTSLVDQNVEKPTRNVHEWYRSGIIDENAAASEQDVGRWLQLSSGVDSYGVAPRSMHSGFGTSPGMARPGTPRQLTAERLIRSTTDFQSELPGSSTLCVKGGLPEPIPKVRQGASKLRVQEWLEASMRNLEASGSELSQVSLQQWLEKSMRTLDDTCPSNSRHDMEEWLQESLRKVQKSKASTPSTREWIKSSLTSLKEEGSEVVEYLQGHIKALQEEASRLSVQEWLEASLIKLQEEDPESSRDDVKEWIQSSLSKFRAVSPETSGHYVKKWLESSLKNLQAPKQNLQEYMKESLVRLRTHSFAPSRSRPSMKQLKVSQETLGARESRGILKHGSSKTILGRPDVSRTNLLSEGYEADRGQEEARGISRTFSTSEVHPETQRETGAGGKWVRDQRGPSKEMLIAKVSNAFFRYRKPLKILLLMILIVLAAVGFTRSRRYCRSPCRGLRPF